VHGEGQKRKRRKFCVLELSNNHGKSKKRDVVVDWAPENKNLGQRHPGHPKGGTLPLQVTAIASHYFSSHLSLLFFSTSRLTFSLSVILLIYIFLLFSFVYALFLSVLVILFRWSFSCFCSTWEFLGAPPRYPV